MFTSIYSLVISRERTGFIWTFWLVRRHLTFSGISYFLFDILRHLLFFCDGQAQMRLNTYCWPEKVRLCWQNMPCFLKSPWLWIKLCSFSFTYFQSPGEVIGSLHKIPLHLTVSSANTKRVQSFENMMDAGTLQKSGLFSLEKKRLRRHDNSCLACKHLLEKECNKLFFMSAEDTRTNGLKLW